MKTKSILCFGGLVLDSFLLIEEGKMEKYGIKKGQLSLYDDLTPPEHMQRMREEQPFTEFAMGGSGINTLKAYAMMGGASGLVCSHGNDAGKDFTETACKKLGIELFPQQSADYPTSYLMILVTPDAQRTVIGSFYPSFQLDSSKIDYSQLAKYDYSFLEAYSFSKDPTHDAIFKVLEHLEKCNGKFIFALSNVFCIHQFKEEITKFVNHVNCKAVVGNAQEFLALYPSFTKTEDLAHHLLDYNKKHNKWEFLVITDGEHGAWLIHRHSLLFVPAPKVDVVVDTTGAGDYFAGCAIFALVNGYPLEAAAHVSSLLAGHIITKVGVVPSDDVIEEAKNYLSQFQPK